MYMMHKGYFTRKMLSKIQSGLHKGLSASLQESISFQLLFSPASPNLLSLTEPPLFSACRAAPGAGCSLSFPSLSCSERWSELPEHHSQNCCLPSFFATYFLQTLKNKLASSGLEQPNGAGRTGI